MKCSHLANYVHLGTEFIIELLKHHYELNNKQILLILCIPITYNPETIQATVCNILCLTLPETKLPFNAIYYYTADDLILKCHYLSIFAAIESLRVDSSHILTHMYHHHPPPQ